MSSPYGDLPPTHFWKKAVADVSPEEVFPIPAKRFQIGEGARIATAGSCFAQEVGRYLNATNGVDLLIVESPEDTQPLFSARYGNVYTIDQLVQLFDRAYGAFVPVDIAWQRNDGRFVDPFRPYMFRSGFASVEELLHERDAHLAAVRRVFAQCSVFIFTLGLTECWRSVVDGAVLPLAPGVVTDNISANNYEFHNARYDSIISGLQEFSGRLRRVNPSAPIILTVSPVPLIATYTQEHVLVATTYSKSVLRAACAEAELSNESVYYFPSYEIISGFYSKGRYYNDNMRTITPSGVTHVMEAFKRTYFLQSGDGKDQRSYLPVNASRSPTPTEIPICDEEEIVKSIGFS